MFALLATRCSIARYSKQHYCEHCATCTSLSNHKNLPEHQHIAACVYTSLSSSSKRSTYGHTHTGTNTYLFAPLCAVVSRCPGQRTHHTTRRDAVKTQQAGTSSGQYCALLIGSNDSLVLLLQRELARIMTVPRLYEPPLSSISFTAMDNAEQYDRGLGLHSSVAVGVMSTNTSTSDAVHDVYVLLMFDTSSHARLHIVACSPALRMLTMRRCHTGTLIYILSLATGASRMHA
eukprot:15793-Heterococcus_DN1.PRE.2